MAGEEMPDEVGYDRLRLTQWLHGRARAAGVSRRGLLQLSAGAGLAAIPGLALASRPATAAPAGPATTPAATAGPIVKPLPPAVLTLEHPVLPALRPGLSDRRCAGLPPGRQERIRTALGRPTGRRTVAPAARAVLVRPRTRPQRRGQHRRRYHLAARDAARARPARCLAAVAAAVAAGSTRPLHASCPGHRRHRRHPTRPSHVQHDGVSLRRGRPPPRDRRLAPATRRSPAPWPDPIYTGLLVATAGVALASGRSPG